MDVLSDCKGIYKIVNLKTNKKYIGKTMDRFIERYWNHTWKLKNKVHDNKYLQYSWDKYGEDAFSFEVVKVYVDGEDIDALERFYIDYFDTYKNGYNLTVGGEGTKGYVPTEENKRIVGEKNRINNLGKKHSKETREKMSKAHKGYVKTSEHRRNLSLSLKGKFVSDETRQKLRELNTGSKSPVTKFTEEDVYNIKLKLLCGEIVSNIAKEYSVSYSTISAIAHKRTWNHVKLEKWEDWEYSSKYSNK